MNNFWLDKDRRNKQLLADAMGIYPCGRGQATCSVVCVEQSNDRVGRAKTNWVVTSPEDAKVFEMELGEDGVYYANLDITNEYQSMITTDDVESYTSNSNVEASLTFAFEVT